MKPVPVGVLGATGMVGQRMIALLARHPTLRVAWVGASERSAGRPYGEVVRWVLPGDPPEDVARMTVETCDPARVPGDLAVLLSALDGAAARPLEPTLAEAGFAVVTNASAHRMDPRVPLVIPEVNPDHLSILDGRAGRGFILANPNCCAIPVAMALAPLHRRWPVLAMTVATWQAVSGAGYPGEPSYDIVGTVHPHAGDEEEKLDQEPQKLLGLPDRPAPFRVSARCVRVPVADGHLIGMNVRLQGDPSPEEALEALRSWRGEGPELPSCPRPPLRVTTRRDRPSTRHDVDDGDGMIVTVGRVERCPVMGLKLYALGHNAVRGAAGAAIANAELLLASGRVDARGPTAA